MSCDVGEVTERLENNLASRPRQTVLSTHPNFNYIYADKQQNSSLDVVDCTGNTPLLTVYICATDSLYLSLSSAVENP